MVVKPDKHGNDGESDDELEGYNIDVIHNDMGVN